VGDERAVQASATSLAADSSAASEFETLAGRVMSVHFGIPLSPRRHSVIAKTFDLVSEDWSIVGDAKFYTLVGGERLPPAKFATIAEHVWLLEKTSAKNAFLVFGNDRRVPVEWLKRYGNLVADVSFFFVDDAERLEELAVSEESCNKRQTAGHMIAGSKLERHVHRQMLGIYRSAASELGYRATRFHFLKSSITGVACKLQENCCTALAIRKVSRRSGNATAWIFRWRRSSCGLPGYNCSRRRSCPSPAGAFANWNTMVRKCDPAGSFAGSDAPAASQRSGYGAGRARPC